MADVPDKVSPAGSGSLPAGGPTPPAWGHATGNFDLSAGPPAMLAPADRLEITERLYRYCVGYDERRADVLRDCFTDDGVWEATITGHTAVGPFQGADEVVAFLLGFWREQTDQRRHIFTNVFIDRAEGDRARAICYLQLLSSRSGRAELETTGIYRFDLRRDAGVWRITHLFAGFDSPF